MLTWRLWTALRYPEEEHPLFRLIQRRIADLPAKRLLSKNLASRFLWAVLRTIIAVIIVIIAPVALFVEANLFGGFLAFNIMSTINREREQGTYDLLALTPTGLGASNWLIATAWTQRLGIIDHLATIRVIVLIVLGSALATSVGAEHISRVTLLALLLALNANAIQSLIVGCLSGMLAQTFEGNSSPFIAIGVFTFAQVIAVYLPTTLAVILLHDALRPLGGEYLTLQAVVALVGLALLFTLHEIVIRWMWRELERRLL